MLHKLSCWRAMAEDALQAAMELLDRMEDSYTELVRKQEQHRLVVKKSNLDEQRHQVTVRENAQLRKQLSIVASKLKLGLKEIEHLSNQNAEVNKQLIQSANQWSILNRKLEEQEAEVFNCALDWYEVILLFVIRSMISKVSMKKRRKPCCFKKMLNCRTKSTKHLILTS